MKLTILALWVLELLLLGWYIKSGWPVRTKRSFSIKIACSTVFLAYGIFLAVSISHGANVSFASGSNELSSAAGTFIQFPNGTRTSRVVHLVIAALAYGWLGDFFLGLAHQVKGRTNTENEKDVDYKDQLKNKKTAINALGVLSFILGHILYCVAFGRAIAGYGFSLRWWFPVLLLLPLLAYLVMALRMKLGKHLIPLAVYFLAVSGMFALSLTLGAALWSVSIPFGICLIAGGILFSLGDLLLALESYGGERFKMFGLRVVRQIAYFVAQMLFATTILFFYAV